MRCVYLLLASALGVGALAAPPQPFTRATIPDKASLERLNLKTEWAIFLPNSGREDGIATMQLVDEHQMFVQTRAGLLIAIDAKTGRHQWSYKYPFAHPAVFPIAVNEKFVFAYNVAKLYVMNRLNGAIEMEYELGAAPSVGPVVDFEQVYVCYTSKTVQALALPQNLRTAAAPKNLPKQITLEDIRKQTGGSATNIADDVARQLAKRNNPGQPRDREIDRIPIPKGYLSDAGGQTTVNPDKPPATPSLAAVHSVTPPYMLKGLNKVESLQTLRSLQRPYQLKPDYMTYNQPTPSIGAIPPSVARIHELANLRPPELAPERKWLYAVGGAVAFEPTLIGNPVSTLLWIPTYSSAGNAARSIRTQSNRISAVPAISGPVFGQASIKEDLSESPAAPMAGPAVYEKDMLHGFLPLGDGQLLALDLNGGSEVGIRTLWKANVGGLMNHKPLAAKDGVYVSGDRTGVAKINVDTGEVVWRTESGADQVLAVNEEFVYVRDRRGQLLVYAKDRISDARTKKATPLAAMNIDNLNIHYMNELTDRIFLAAENGLIVCLRDSAGKYAKSKIVVPAKYPAPSTVAPMNPDMKPGDVPPPEPAKKD